MTLRACSANTILSSGTDGPRVADDAAADADAAEEDDEDTDDDEAELASAW